MHVAGAHQVAYNAQAHGWQAGVLVPHRLVPCATPVMVSVPPCTLNVTRSDHAQHSHNWHTCLSVHRS